MVYTTSKHGDLGDNHSNWGISLQPLARAAAVVGAVT
jgi:hypothetical protein